MTSSPVIRRIEDSAMLGDGRTAALVGLDGSVDWLCLPRFDAPAVFAALLGDPGNGRWRLVPQGKVVRRGRRYRPGTMILETRFETEAGSVLVTDLLDIGGDTPALIRTVSGERGVVAMEGELVLRSATDGPSPG